MNSVHNKKVAFTTKELKVNKRRNILVLTNNIEKGHRYAEKENSWIDKPCVYDMHYVEFCQYK